MARETYYTLLVNGEPKRLNDDLKRLQGMAADYMTDENELTIRCPQSGGSGAPAALLTYDKAKRAWVGAK